MMSEILVLILKFTYFGDTKIQSGCHQHFVFRSMFQMSCPTAQKIVVQTRKKELVVA